jgi:hypothetical protein
MQGSVMPFCVVLISDVPEIDIEEDLVTSGEDYETKLKCVVHAEPKAEVHWLKDNATVSDLDHVRTSTEGNRHYYHIAKTQVSDFGKYKCVATNSMGTTSSKEIELTGKLSLIVNTLLKSYPADTHVNWFWWRYFKFFSQIIFGLRSFSSFNFLIL